MIRLKLPPCWVVNLGHERERWDAFRQENAWLFEGGYAVRRFDAITPPAPAEVSVSARVRAMPDADKVIGCFLSHQALFRRLASVETERFLIIEDDARLAREELVAAFLARAPADYNMLFLGHCFETMGEEVAPGVHRSVQPRCTHAYIVSSEAARVLLEAMRSISEPVDEVVGRCIADGTLNGCYSAFPLLSVQPWQRERLT